METEKRKWATEKKKEKVKEKKREKEGRDADRWQ